MREVKVITPTIRRILDRRAARRERLFIYVPLAALAKVAPLGPSAALLYAMLYSIQSMHTKDGPFPVPTPFEEALGRGVQWWYRHASTLEREGLVEVIRKDGARPRYRLRPLTKGRGK